MVVPPLVGHPVNRRAPKTIQRRAGGGIQAATNVVIIQLPGIV
jgi:hypothetical protein